MKAVAGFQQADRFCHHLCANPLCGHVFDDLEKAQWESHRDECCPECCMRRFKHVAGRLAPRRRCVAVALFLYAGWVFLVLVLVAWATP